MNEEALQQLARDMAFLRQESHQQNETLTRLNLTTARVLKLLDGDPQEDIAGIRPRVTQLERQMNAYPVDLPAQILVLRESIKALQDEASAWKNRYIGGKWVLTLLGLTNAATVAAVIRLLFGAH